jgi:hypothetical protein
MGRALVESAKEITSQLPDEDAFPPELAERIVRCRGYEDNGDLLKIPYESWNLMGGPTQTAFRIHLDPLFFNGVWVSKDKFVAAQREVMSQMSPHAVFYLISNCNRWELLGFDINPRSQNYHDTPLLRKSFLARVRGASYYCAYCRTVDVKVSGNMRKVHNDFRVLEGEEAKEILQPGYLVR